jgi:hypothetical protein
MNILFFHMNKQKETRKGRERERKEHISRGNEKNN